LGFLTDSSFYLAATIVSSGINLLLLPLYTRFLSPSDFGVIALFGTFGMITTGLVSMGIHKATYKFYFDYVNDEEELVSIVSTNLFYLIFIFYITGTIIYFNSTWFSINLFDNQINNKLINLSFFSGCLTYFITFITLLLTAQKRSKEYALVVIFRAIINNLLSFYFIFAFSLTYMAKIYASIITQTLLLLILLVLIRNLIGIKLSLINLKKSLVFSYPNVPRSIIGLVYKSFDKILLNKFTGLNSVGYYAIGSQLANLIKLLINTLAKSFNPFFFSLANKRGMAQKDSIVKRFYEVAFVIMFFGLCIITFSEELIKLLATEKFDSAMYVIPVYAFYHLFAVIGLLSVPQIMFAEKMFYLLPQTIISIIVNILLNIALIPSYGAVGAALATAIAQLGTCIVSYYFAQKAFYLPINLSKALKLYLVLLILSVAVYPIMISDMHMVYKIMLKIVIISIYIFYGFINSFVSINQIKNILPKYHLV